MQELPDLLEARLDSIAVEEWQIQLRFDFVSLIMDIRGSLPYGSVGFSMCYARIIETSVNHSFEMSSELQKRPVAIFEALLVFAH